MTTKRERSLTGARLGLVGKGGSGKSTVTVLLAKTLRRSGYGVVVLDADSTNVGLAGALGIDASQRTLVDHFGGMVFSGGAVTCPVDDPTPLAGAELSLAHLPQEVARRSPDGIWLLEAGKMGHRGPGAGCDGPIAKIARDVRVRGDGEDPVTLIDFKAGFEDTARGVITGLNWVIAVVDPTLAAVRLALDMTETVRRIRAGAPPATRHLDSPRLVDLAQRMYRSSRIRGVLAVLNKIPDRQTEAYLRERLAGRGIEPLAVIREDRSIAARWLRAESLCVGEAEDELRLLCRRLELAHDDATAVACSAVGA